METTDYEHGSVPENERKNWLTIALIWVAVGIDLSGAFLGVQLASGMSFWSAIAATFVGSLLLGMLAMACAYVGASTGLSTANISRVVFGRVGSVILASAIAISLLGWFAVQAGFFGLNAQLSFVEFTGIEVPVQVFTGIGAVLMALTAFWGYRSISGLSSIAVPLLLALLILGIIVAFIVGDPSNISRSVESSIGFGTAVSLVMGIFVLGVVVSPDMARWAKSPRQAMAAGFVGFFFGNSIILVVSILLSRLMDESELVLIFFALGLGGIAVIVLILAQWTTNTTNLYSAGLNFSTISDKFNRRIVTLVLAVIGLVVAVLGAADYFIEFLLIMGSLIAPFGGVYLATFFTTRRRTIWSEGADIPLINVYATIAWAGGILVAFATTDPASGPGLGWFTLTTISALDGLLVGLILTLLFLPLQRRERAQVPANESVASKSK